MNAQFRFRRQFAAFFSCTRGATATLYVIVVGCVALVASVAFTQLRKDVESAAKAEALALATAKGNTEDGPSGSLYAEVSAAGVEEALAAAPWAMAAKGAEHGASAAFRKRRAKGSNEFENKRAAGDAPTPKPDDGRPGCTGANCGRTSCFVAGTQIPTPDGLRPIESLGIGDEVFSRNRASGRLIVERIEATKTTPNMPVVAVEIETKDRTRSQVVSATRGHFFWTTERAWSRADELVPGDELVDASGDILYVLNVTSVEKPEVVYSFELANNSHFVGEVAVWVRNPLGRRDPTEAPQRGTP